MANPFSQWGTVAFYTGLQWLQYTKARSVTVLVRGPLPLQQNHDHQLEDCNKIGKETKFPKPARSLRDAPRLLSCRLELMPRHGNIACDEQLKEELTNKI